MKKPRGRMERRLMDREHGGIPWASPVKITKPDGTVEYQRSLTYRQRRNLAKTGDRERRGFLIPPKLRAQVLARDRNACVYCGDVEGPFEMDHVRPYSRGGIEHIANLVTACQSCNEKKSNRWNGESLNDVLRKSAEI